MRDSQICQPMVRTGFRDVIGSWKIIAISLPRIDRIEAPSGGREARSTSPPSSERRNTIRPPSIFPLRFGRRFMIDSAVTLLPQPLSPTTPSVSPVAQREVDVVDGAHDALDRV